MRNTAVVMWAAAALVAGVVYTGQGTPGVLAGVGNAGRTALQVALLLLAAFGLSGLVAELASKELINRWLGERSGWRGLILASLAGGLIPGGPYVYYPLAASLLAAGADLGVAMAFLAGKSLWALSRLALEFALLGPEVTWRRLLLTLLFPPLIGYLARLLPRGTTGAVVRDATGAWPSPQGGREG